MKRSNYDLTTIFWLLFAVAVLASYPHFAAWHEATCKKIAGSYTQFGGCVWTRK